MTRQILVHCDCDHIYISTKLHSQCSKCKARNRRETSDLPDWIRWDKDKGKYVLVNSH